MIRGFRVVAAILLVGLLAAGCGSTGASTGASDSAEPSGGPIDTNPLGVVPADSMSLAINNSTTLTVSLYVNGSLIASVDPSTCLGCAEDDERTPPG